MKLEQVLFLVLTLIAVYAYWKSDLDPGHTLVLVALLGFNPEFWVAKDNVLSDIPFLFFFYLTALVVRSARRDSGAWWRWSAVIGLAIYFAVSTRAVGVALGAGLLLYDVLRSRTITRVTVLSITVCAAFLMLQASIVGAGVGGYLYQPLTLHTIAYNIVGYARVLGSFWVGSTPGPFAYVVLGLFAACVLAGLLFQLMRDVTFAETALISYFAIIVLWPSPGGVRMVFPVAPWIGYLAISGCKGLASRVATGYSAAATAALFVLIAVCYLQVYHAISFGPIRQTTGLPEFNQVCRAVRDNTLPQDAIIYFRARALSLYTGRLASAYNYQGRDAELWRWAEHIHARYFVTTDAFDEDRGFLVRFVHVNAPNFDLVYENPHFKLYRVRSFPAELDSQWER
jgi:hypothetical protein